MSASFGRLRKALVLTQSAALSPMNAMHRSMKDDALLPPVEQWNLNVTI